MSRIKVIGIAFVLATLAVVGLSTPPVAAYGCDGCLAGATCYPVGTMKCLGGYPQRQQGFLYECTPNNWSYTGSRCEASF